MTERERNIFASLRVCHLTIGSLHVGLFNGADDVLGYIAILCAKECQLNLLQYLMDSSEKRMRHLHSESVSQVEVTNHFTYRISNNLLSIVLSSTSREPSIRISLHGLIYRLVEGIRAIGIEHKLSQLIVCSRVQVLDLVSHFVTEDKLSTFRDRRVKSDEDSTMHVAIGIRSLLNPAITQLV